jgi:hypothetical protein
MIVKEEKSAFEEVLPTGSAYPALPEVAEELAAMRKNFLTP